MDEIEKRLRDAADRCIESYEVWSKKQKDAAARETLQEAIHELRKVSSRLEIELAASERQEMTQKPIPIPPHRDSRGRGGRGPAGGADAEGNTAGPDEGTPGGLPRKRRGPPRKSAEG
ncbi:MAG: hypothetical protein KDJ75_04770 [Alphaproteobacteria bacterium]|nr:hypothetical protein [Alphaproteobacteria bacterium]